MLRRLLLFSLLLCSLQLFSQVQVFKDPVSCLYGLKGPSGAWILKPEFDNLHKEGEGYITTKNSKYGYIDLNGKVVAECRYDLVDPIRTYPDVNKEKKLYLKVGVKSGNDYKQGLTDRNGQLIFPCEYESVGDLIYNRMTLIKLDSAFLYDENFSLIASFKDVAPDVFHSNSEASLKTIRPVHSPKFGWVKSDGKIQVQAIYDSPLQFSNGLAIVSKGRLRGLINYKGEEILPCEYEMLYKNSQGVPEFYQLTKGDLYGIADVNGTMVVPAVYKRIDQVCNSIYKISGQQFSGLIDLSRGRMLLDTVYRMITITQNDHASKCILAIKGDQLKIYTLSNNSDTLTPYPLKNLANLKDNRALVDQYIIDGTGKIIFEANSLNIGPKSAVGVFHKDGYSGLVGRDGLVRYRSKPNYYIYDLGRNYFAVSPDQQFPHKEFPVEVIDSKGRALKLPEIVGVGQYLPSVDGFWVKPAGQKRKMGGFYRLFKLNTGYASPDLVDNIRDFGTGVWVLSKSLAESQVYALMSPKGKLITPFKYKWAYPVGKKLMYVQDLSGKQSLVDLNGQLKYDNIQNVSLPLNGYFIVKSTEGVSLLDSMGKSMVKFSPEALSTTKRDLFSLLGTKKSPLLYSTYDRKDSIKGPDYYALEQSRGGQVFLVNHKNPKKELVVNNSILSYLFESIENNYYYDHILSRYLISTDTTLNANYVTACGGPGVSRHFLPDTITPTGFSLVYVTEYSYSSSGNIIPEVRNYRFKGDTAAMLIETGDVLSPKCKPALNELLLEKLKEKGLNIKCSDTRALVDQVWRSFTITEDSLKFYFPVDFYPSEDRNPKHILQFVEISFEELRKHGVLR